MRLIRIVLVALICGTVPALAQPLSVDNLYDRVQERFADNGHTPLFHTVNSNKNRSVPILRRPWQCSEGP